MKRETQAGSTRIVDGAVINETYIDGKLVSKTFGPVAPIIIEKDGIVIKITNV